MISRHPNYATDVRIFVMETLGIVLGMEISTVGVSLLRTNYRTSPITSNCCQNVHRGIKKSHQCALQGATSTPKRVQK